MCPCAGCAGIAGRWSLVARGSLITDALTSHMQSPNSRVDMAFLLCDMAFLLCLCSVSAFLQTESLPSSPLIHTVSINVHLRFFPFRPSYFTSLPMPAINKACEACFEGKKVSAQSITVLSPC